MDTFDRGEELGIKVEEAGLNQAKVMKNYILESSFKIIGKQIKRKKKKTYLEKKRKIEKIFGRMGILEEHCGELS